MDGADLIAPRQIIESFLVRFPPHGRRLGCFKTLAIMGLIYVEITAIGSVAFELGAPQSDPPLLSCSVDRFSAGAEELLAHSLRLQFVRGLYEHDTSASAQSILINIDLVVRESGNRILPCIPDRGPPGSAGQAEQTRPKQASHQDRTYSGKHQASQGGPCAEPSCGANRAPNHASDCRSHSRLLGIGYRYTGEVPSRRV